ncbi:CDP-glycerol glycerophosphotransferase family protein [Thiomicrospira cyclica]|uniref:CDP-glycerol glycerophosphotransferase n=1 Tax=Thiomicrospira cyclica (strain DSM 14477 / JCM 11371 / ALM1) TaxID=717773 RepID=F6DCV6_THICA|nr:CDP-glycerol glycerophosphotransferase family protein [Thiomicrospira cyclica]AEG31692.1 CDP-glycerol glycerophosphotransferase [Thiomicrospira cyclica ALM1]
MKTSFYLYSSIAMAKLKRWKHAAKLIEHYLDRQNTISDKDLYRAGVYCFNAKNYNAAATHLEKAYQIKPTEVRALLWADALKFAKKTHAAENVCRQFIELKPKSFLTIFKLATLLRKQKKWWQEIDTLQNGLAIQPKRPKRWYQLGEALEAMNRFQQAAEAYGEAIERKKDTPPAEWYYRQGYCYAQEGHDGPPNPDAAHRAYQQAIEADTQHVAQRFGIGVFHQARGYWPQAAEAYAQQLNTNPQDPELTYKLGMAHDRCYNWAKAALNYQVAIDLQQQQSLDPNPYWFYRLGFVFERLGEGYQSQAIEAYQRANATSEEHRPYWHYRIGYIFNQQGQYQQAAEAFLQTRETQTLPPEESTEASDHQQQINELEKALAQDTTDHQAWYKLGNAYERMQNWPKAAEAYQHALDRQNDHTPEWYYRLGYVLTQAESYQAASEALRETRILQKPYGVPEGAYARDAGFKLASDFTEYYEALELKPDTILFESFNGVSMSCNPYAIFVAMQNDPAYTNWKYIWVVNDTNPPPKEYKKQKNIVFVKKDSDLYLRYLAKCSYLVNNSTYPPYFIRKEGQKYLNTWHGTPWKTLGKDIKNNFMEHKNTQRNFLHATHILSPNTHTTWVLRERYDIEGLYTGKFAETGYPRIDLTLNMDESRKTSLQEKLGLDPNKKTILYAPTWRGTLGSVELEVEKLINEINALKHPDINLLFRGHYFVESAAYENDLGNLVVPQEVNTNELLGIIDVLVTDYSSIAFDFMVTGKPIIYYLEDYEQYKQERGLYFEADKLPGEVAYDIKELKNRVQAQLTTNEKHANYPQAQQDFTPNETGRVSKDVIKWFIEDIAHDKEINHSIKKKNILFFAGQFMPNGITTSFLNLVNNIDSKQYNIALVISPNAIEKDQANLEQFERLPKHIKVIGHVGRMNRTIEEGWVEIKFNQQSTFTNAEMHTVFEKLYTKEFMRVFGRAVFESVIEFSGYSQFWSAVFSNAPTNLVKRKVIYQHNDKFGEFTVRFPGLGRIFEMYKSMDGLISVSEQTRDLNLSNLVAHLNIPKDKFLYCDNLQNPTETLEKSNDIIDSSDELYFSSGKKTFITMGRLSPEKDHAKMISAFKKAIEHTPDIQLIILGDGPLKSELQQQIASLNLEKSVHLLGRRFNPFPLLKRADCFVLSSNHEGQPMVLFEAMILNKPIISTDIVGSRSAIEGRSGHLVENSAEGLAQGMHDFLEGKLAFNTFDLEDYQKNAINMFYEKVCGEKELTHVN